MAGGMITPTLIKKVTQSGGLGSLPLGYLSVAESQKAIREVKTLISQRFAVSIFIPAVKSHSSSKQVKNMLEYINNYRTQTGLPTYSEMPTWVETDIDELIAMIISEGISILSFTFGILSANLMNELHKNNVFVMGTATTIEEGLALEAAGCHAVIAQGSEAGGHRGGGFLDGQPGGLIGTMALVPQMVDALTIPVIASGGIMDGRGIAAALALGASAVQIGTAFLVCDESNASHMHKQMVLKNYENSTGITSVFTGKQVRGFKNEFVALTEQKFSNDELLPYPLQHQITKELRSIANKSGNSDIAGMWSGQGTRLSRSLSVSALMDALEKETVTAVSQFKMFQNGLPRKSE
jgi:nitronate monooxygenase